jgi:hypothetical protein
MRKPKPRWTGEVGMASLPAKIENDLRRRAKNVLERHGVADEVANKIVVELVEEVTWAYAGRAHKLESGGPGRPLRGADNLLAVNVADLLKKQGIRGNWLSLGDDEEDGLPGPVAELEAIAQTAFREACGEEKGVRARPARISKARKTLGKIERFS